MLLSTWYDWWNHTISLNNSLSPHWWWILNRRRCCRSLLLQIVNLNSKPHDSWLIYISSLLPINNLLPQSVNLILRITHTINNTLILHFNISNLIPKSHLLSLKLLPQTFFSSFNFFSHNLLYLRPRFGFTSLKLLSHLFHITTLNLSLTL